MAGDRESGYNAYSLFLIFILLYLSQKSIKASAYHQDSNSEQQGTSLNEKFAVLVPDGGVMEYAPSQKESMEESMEDQSVVEETVANEVEEIEPDLTLDPIVGGNEEFHLGEPEEISDEAEPMENTVAPIDEKEEVVEQIKDIEELNEVEELNDVVDEIKEESIQDILPIVIPEPIEEVSLAEPPKDIENIKDIPMEQEVNIKGDEKEVVEDEPVLGGQSNLFLKPTVMNSVKTKKQQTGPKISFKYGQ
ncbi:hypothetical protein JCM14036_35660 [Desulfotomaculum defluvii]